MGLEVGGYNSRPDFPKMGPSLLIASCLILAIGTAKWPPNCDPSLAEKRLEDEIDFSIQTANRVLANLVAKYASLFPHVKEPWYQPDNEDVRE